MKSIWTKYTPSWATEYLPNVRRANGALGIQGFDLRRSHWYHQGIAGQGAHWRYLFVFWHLSLRYVHRPGVTPRHCNLHVIFKNNDTILIPNSIAQVEQKD